MIRTRRGTVVGLKDDGEKKKNEGVVEKKDEKTWVEKEKEQYDEEVEEKVVSEEEMQKLKKQATDKGKVVLDHQPVQHLPYLHALPKKDKERQYKRFLDIFKWLQINIPFSEALKQMPTYDKFINDLLTKNRRIMDDETVEDRKSVV